MHRIWELGPGVPCDWAPDGASLAAAGSVAAKSALVFGFTKASVIIAVAFVVAMGGLAVCNGRSAVRRREVIMGCGAVASTLLVALPTILGMGIVTTFRLGLDFEALAYASRSSKEYGRGPGVRPPCFMPGWGTASSAMLANVALSVLSFTTVLAFGQPARPPSPLDVWAVPACGRLGSWGCARSARVAASDLTRMHRERSAAASHVGPVAGGRRQWWVRFWAAMWSALVLPCPAAEARAAVIIAASMNGFAAYATVVAHLDSRYIAPTASLEHVQAALNATVSPDLLATGFFFDPGQAELPLRDAYTIFAVLLVLVWLVRVAIVDSSPAIQTLYWKTESWVRPSLSGSLAVAYLAMELLRIYLDAGRSGSGGVGLIMLLEVLVLIIPVGVSVIGRVTVAVRVQSATERLTQVESTLRAFILWSNHELRTLLTPVQLAADELLDVAAARSAHGEGHGDGDAAPFAAGEEDADLAALAGSIRDSASRASGLLTSVLDYFRAVTAGREAAPKCRWSPAGLELRNSIGTAFGADVVVSGLPLAQLQCVGGSPAKATGLRRRATASLAPSTGGADEAGRTADHSRRPPAAGPRLARLQVHQAGGRRLAPLHLDLDASLDATEVFTDMEAVSLAATNFVTNALKFRQPGSQVKVRAALTRARGWRSPVRGSPAATPRASIGSTAATTSSVDARTRGGATMADVVPNGALPDAVAVERERTGAALLVIEVEDDGTGVPRSGRKNLFRAFKDVGTSAEGAVSTGIGLALVRESADRLGGEVGYCTAQAAWPWLPGKASDACLTGQHPSGTKSGQTPQTADPSSVSRPPQVGPSTALQASGDCRDSSAGAATSTPNVSAAEEAEALDISAADRQPVAPPVRSKGPSRAVDSPSGALWQVPAARDAKSASLGPAHLPAEDLFDSASTQGSTEGANRGSIFWLAVPVAVRPVAQTPTVWRESVASEVVDAVGSVAEVGQATSTGAMRSQRDSPQRGKRFSGTGARDNGAEASCTDPGPLGRAQSSDRTEAGADLFGNADDGTLASPQARKPHASATAAFTASHTIQVRGSRHSHGRSATASPAPRGRSERQLRRERRALSRQISSGARSPSSSSSTAAAGRAASALGGSRACTSSGARGVVLIVDDSAAVRRGLGTAVRRLGFDAQFASNGQEGLASLRASCSPGGERVAAVLLDKEMPVLDGIGFLRLLRAGDLTASEDRGGAVAERMRRVPVLLVTGSVDVELQRLALSLGASALIPKPVSRADILQGLRSVGLAV